MTISTRILCGVALAALAGCSSPASGPAASATTDTTAAEAAITGALVLEHTRVLASDEFEGRLPGSPGEEKTVEYLIEQFKALGLQPGNPDGSWIQNVPLVGITGTPTMSLRVGATTIPMTWKRDFVAATERVEPKVQVDDSDVVFVGYGVQAPEYEWDDYKGLDVRGKTIVMLINDPAVPSASDAKTLDPAFFKGEAMTYYGRWTYKYEIASKLGAAAAIIVHETEPAAYPWSVVEHSWTGEQFSLSTPDRNAGRVPVQAWITLDKAKALFAAAGQDFDALKQRAVTREFTPVALGAKASMTVTNTIREVQSRNVVALLPGSDEALRNEYVVYTAHWDHLGRNPDLEGDQIFNGAVDNATGTAALLAIAKGFTELPVKPKRSVVFLSVTAEEQGLLGSLHYATNPLYPIEKTLANLNMDALNPVGPTTDIQIIGYGQNTLEDLFTEFATKKGRTVLPDSETPRGYYYRSDQFNFARKGVPALYPKAGEQVIGKPEGHGKTRLAEFTAKDYHAPSDEVKDDWDLDGIAEDARLLFQTGLAVANGSTWPTWKDGSEFKAIREASLKGTR